MFPSFYSIFYSNRINAHPDILPLFRFLDFFYDPVQIHNSLIPNQDLRIVKFTLFHILQQTDQFCPSIFTGHI